MLDLLGPGISLELDQSAFPIFFAGDLGRESAEVEAERLAKEHHCTFMSTGISGHFRRAYAKGVE